MGCKGRNAKMLSGDNLKNLPVWAPKVHETSIRLKKKKDHKPCAETRLWVILNLSSVFTVAASQATRDQQQIKLFLRQIRLTFKKEHFEDVSWKHRGRRDLFKPLNTSQKVKSPQKAEVKSRQRVTEALWVVHAAKHRRKPWFNARQLCLALVNKTLVFPEWGTDGGLCPLWLLQYKQSHLSFYAPNLWFHLFPHIGGKTWKMQLGGKKRILVCLLCRLCRLWLHRRTTCVTYTAEREEEHVRRQYAELKQVFLCEWEWEADLLRLGTKTNSLMVVWFFFFFCEVKKKTHNKSAADAWILSGSLWAAALKSPPKMLQYFHSSVHKSRTRAFSFLLFLLLPLSFIFKKKCFAMHVEMQQLLFPCYSCHLSSSQI